MDKIKIRVKEVYENWWEIQTKEGDEPWVSLVSQPGNGELPPKGDMKPNEWLKVVEIIVKSWKNVEVIK